MSSGIGCTCHKVSQYGALVRVADSNQCRAQLQISLHAPSESRPVDLRPVGDLLS